MGVNGVSVKGKTKVEVAKMIQASKVRNIEYLLRVSEMITLNFTATFFLFFSSFTFMIVKTTHLHVVPRLTHCRRAGLLIKYPLVTGRFKRF